MQSEYSAIASLLDGSEPLSGRLFDYRAGVLGENRVVICQSGIGKVNSSLCAQELITLHSPDCIISTGVAGGIDTRLNVMDIVASSRCCYHDVWCGDGNLKGQVQGLPLYFESCTALLNAAAEQGGATLHSGLITSGDQFITNREELATIKSTHPEALAVDMESTSIAQCCYLYGVPFLSLRVISDTPAATKDHAAQYENFWGEIASRSFTNIERLLRALPTTI